MNKDEQIDYSQPVAYDRDGRPLYAHPPQLQQKNHAHQQVVHVARAAEPLRPILSEEIVRRHKESITRYPRLNLSEGEYVINMVRRHPIGLLLPIIGAGLLILVIITALISYPLLVPDDEPPFDALLLPSLLLAGLIGLGAYIVSWVYLNNRFFLTNESVIQEIQMSLFARNEQTVSLRSIEDASYTQIGILQHVFNYGSIRLSTEGDETTYRFKYVSNPKKQIATLNNAVEAFKLGRPVEDQS